MRADWLRHHGRRIKKPRAKRGSGPRVSVPQWASLGLTIGLLFLCASVPATGQVRVRTAGQPGERTLRTARFDGALYVSAEELAEVLGARVFTSSKAPKVVLTFDGSEITLTAWNPFVVIEGDAFQLLGEVALRGDELWVPADQFLALLARRFPDRIHYRKEDRTLELQPLSHNLLAISTEDKVNGVLVSIRTSRPFAEKHVSTRFSHGWLYIDIYGGKIDSSRLKTTNRSKLVRKIVPLQLGETAQISLRLRQEVGQRKVYVREDPPSILVSLRTSEAISADVLEALRRERRKWVIDTVVIDPGHGGHDPGAIGRNGTYEKNVTLAIAKRLKYYLERDVGVKVYLTRNGDQFVPLKDRTKFANKMGAKLFISIHANANRSRRVGGATTYFLGPAKTEEAREVARLENSVIRYEDDVHAYEDLTDENFILAAMAQNAFNHESQDLAALIQQNLARYTGLEDRGVKQAGYYVLIGAAMPNVLVETAFISNPREERLLRSKKFQDRVARAIAAGVKAFKNRYEKDFASLE